MIAKEENRELFGPGGCLTREAIALHIDGKLTDAEAKKVMRHAKHCDLCAGALEGALMLDSGMHFNRAVSRLDNSPWRKSLTSQSHNKRLFYGFSSIAASVIILIGVFYITKMRDRLTGYPGYVSGEIVVVDDFEVVDSVPDNVLMIREPLSENNSAAKKHKKITERK